jgi:hypothetical protein
MSESFKCQHGGPGELVVETKKLFLLSVQHNLEQLHFSLQRNLDGEFVIASELVLLEELISNSSTLKDMVDGSLVKLYFTMATELLLLLNANPSLLDSDPKVLEDCKTHCRMGIYLTMILLHGAEPFWNMTKESPKVQSKRLKDMYNGIAKISTFPGLAEFLNVQTSCHCVEQALPTILQMNSCSICTES